MRLLPRSLFGRLILILSLGLILAQILGATLTLRDQSESLRESLGMQLMQRIGSITNLLEQMPREEHKKIVAALDSQSLRVILSEQPLSLAGHFMPSRHLEFMLQRELSKQTEVHVEIMPLSQDPEHRPPSWMRHSETSPPMMMQHMMPGRILGFQAQIQLSTGEWLNFRRPLPDNLFSWPKKLLGYLLILLISVIGISLLAVRLVTRPLGTLAKAAHDLGVDIQQPPLDESGPAEVQKAARAFNTMQHRLQRYIEDRSQILAAVSHDLKTPITRLRLRTELLNNPEIQEKISGDLDAMETMVTATLDFMRGTETSEKSVPIDMVALLESLQSDSMELGWKVSLDKCQAAPYTGRPLVLKRCLVNLIENAARYGEEAIIQMEDTAEQLTIIIADKGDKISGDELEMLFKPFYRGESSRNRATGGTGLGLGIARNIARAHGGDVVLRKGKMRGIEAVVTLPR